MGENELPNGWGFAIIQDVAPAGGTRDPKGTGTNDFFYVDIEAIDNTKQKIVAPKRLAVKEAPSRARMAIQAGDIIFSLVRPYLKNLAVVPPELDGQIASTAYCVMRPVKGIISSFVFYYQLQDSFIHLIITYGNSPPSAHDDEFLAMSIPVAPTAEQQRIVAAIEQQFTRLDAGVAALKSAKTRLKRYHAAVLKAAVEGKLTEAWRAEHPTSEPASQLLARILQERRAKWEADLRAKGKDPAKVKYVEPASPDVSELGELPEGWCWATVEQICERIADCLHSTPSFKEKGFICVDTNCIKPGRIIYSKVRFVDEPTFIDRNSRMKPQENDVLFSREGALLGVAVCVPPSPEICLGQRMMIFRPASCIHARYYETFLNSSPFQTQYKSEIAGTASPHLNIRDICKFAIAVPPLEEQQQIVSEVERRLSVVSQLEAIVEANLKRAERLRQSILKEAFAGRLVSQDPDDEPASVLLERIRKERETADNGNKGRKQGKQHRTDGNSHTAQRQATPQEAYGENRLTREPESIGESEIAQVALWNAD